MTNQSLNQDSDPDLGYVFSPTSHPGQLGHRQIDILLHGRPTFQHFDPEYCSFWAAPDMLGNMEIQVRHPWKEALSYRVLAGRLVMADRVGKVVEAIGKYSRMNGGSDV